MLFEEDFCHPSVRIDEYDGPGSVVLVQIYNILSRYL